MPRKEGERGVKEEWTITNVGEFAPFTYGKGLPERNRNVSGAIPVFGSNGIVGYHDAALTDGPTIVIGRKGTVGAVHFSPVPCWPIDTTFFVTGSDPDLLRFAYYSLKALRLEDMNTDSAVPGLNRTAAHARVLHVPTESEQRAIAHILGTLDDKIELNRRMNERLEDMARALFKSWFVEFDPVRAKMEGRWRRGESLPGMPAELYDLFPDGMVDSELGDIPEGWEVRTFGTLLDDVIGGDWGKEAPDGVHTEPVSIIRGTDLPSLLNGGIGSVPLRYTTKKKAERRRLMSGDIVIEVSGGSPTQPTGRSMIITQDVLDRFKGIVVCASFCRRFRPHGWREALIASWHLDFIHSIGKMWYYQLQSTGIANFQTKQFLQEESIVWPGDGLLDRYTEIVEPIVRLMARNDNVTLTALRDVLLPKLISGEIRLKEAKLLLGGVK